MKPKNQDLILNQLADDVTGKLPKQLLVLGEKITVSSWRDVMAETLNTIFLQEPEKSETLLALYPRSISKDKAAFRHHRKLSNGYFIEVTFSARDIQKFCIQVIQHIGKTAKDWQVIFK